MLTNTIVAINRMRSFHAKQLHSLLTVMQYKWVHWQVNRAEVPVQGFTGVAENSVIASKQRSSAAMWCFTLGILDTNEIIGCSNFKNRTKLLCCLKHSLRILWLRSRSISRLQNKESKCKTSSLKLLTFGRADNTGVDRSSLILKSKSAINCHPLENNFQHSRFKLISLKWVLLSFV